MIMVSRRLHLVERCLLADGGKLSRDFVNADISDLTPGALSRGRQVHRVCRVLCIVYRVSFIIYRLNYHSVW